MAWPSLLSAFLCFLVFFHGCNAWRLRPQNQCNLQNLTASEPTIRLVSEAGIADTWDVNNEQFRCAGVIAFRRTIEPRGLLLPAYSNAPLLGYVVQGSGIQGTVFPGCAETFQSTQQFQHQEESQRFRDPHQKIQHLREGDVFAIPAGYAYWTYNDGESRLVIVNILDVANAANQLDLNPRIFSLAGNPPIRNEQQRQNRSGSNIFSGFDYQILAEAFGVDEEIARKLHGENDHRGFIVRAKGRFEVPRQARSRKEREREREQQQQRGDWLDETFCTMSMGENIDDPSYIDFYNPRAGRLSFLNSLRLPILKYLQLSAEKGVLYEDAMLVPHWNSNAHTVVYAIKGEAQCQIVDNLGQAVFDGHLRQGQLVVVPQDFAVVARAGSQGFEWVAFKTNKNSVSNTLAGRASIMRGLPLDVITNAYRISRNEARKLKFGRDETVIFPPFSNSTLSEERASA